MRITMDNISKINFAGLVLTFSRVAKVELAGKLHIATCNAAKQTHKIERMDSEVIENTMDLIEREYGVTLCKCAKHHNDVK